MPKLLVVMLSTLILARTPAAGQANLCRPFAPGLPPERVVQEQKQRDINLVQILKQHLTRAGDQPAAHALQGAIPCLSVTPVPGGNRALAEQVATGPGVVTEGTRRLKQLHPDSWVEAAWELERHEALSWKAIPPELRKAVPTVQRFTWPSGPCELDTVRVKEQWKVSAVRCPRT